MLLSSFIGAAEWSEFADSYQTRQFTSHPVASTPDRFQSLWSHWELDAQCRFTRVVQDEGFRLFTRGRMVPRDAYLDKGGAFREDVMKKLWASGVSITIRHLEDHSNPILAITRSLEASCQCPVQVNLYVTPGEGQALGAHFDDHDVLVLQVEGAKEWEVYAGRDGAPGTAEATATGSRPTGTPTVVRLERGGWLYVPRGVWHEVRNQAAEPSVHFTISFHPMTWARLIQEGLEQALRREPSFELACPGGNPDYRVQVNKYLTMIPAFVEPPDNYYRKFKNLKLPVPLDALTDRASLQSAAESTAFAWRVDQVETSDDPSVLNLGYRRRPLVLRPELAPTVSEMAQKGSFRPAELASLDPASALLLSKFLTNVGLLRLGK